MFQAKSLRLCFLPLLILTLALFSIAQELAPEMLADVNRRISLQRDWGQKMSSPGAQLVVKETDRAKAGGLLVAKYELYAHGLPQDVPYELMMYPINIAVGDVPNSDEVHLEKDGHVVDGPDDPVAMILADPAPGEPFRFALTSKQGDYKAFASVVPNPIEGRDRECRITITRLLPRFELAFIQATGFPADTEIELQSNSLGEIHNAKLKTNAEGYVDASIMPFVKDKAEGRTRIKLISSKCHPEVTFNWGTTH